MQTLLVGLRRRALTLLLLALPVVVFALTAAPQCGGTCPHIG
jgi:hypothetical protein